MFFVNRSVVDIALPINNDISPDIVDNDPFLSR